MCRRCGGDGPRSGDCAAFRQASACLSRSLPVVATAGDRATGTLSVTGPFDAADETATGTDTGDRVVWDAAVAPDAEVAHQRTGPPYAVRTTVPTWCVGVSDGSQEVLLSATGAGGPDVPLRARASAGYRIGSADGVEFLVEQGVGEQVEPGVGTDVPPGSPWAWAVGDVASGVTVSGGVDRDGRRAAPATRPDPTTAITAGGGVRFVRRPARSTRGRARHASHRDVSC